MNPSDHRLNRLLDAAQMACPPIPEPSAWFEQRMVMILKAQDIPSYGLFDGRLIFRMLAGAVLIMTVSVILSVVQVKNPYLETMEQANTMAQMEKLP